MMLRLRRVGSLALLLALLGGGLGLPLFDVVVFHGDPGGTQSERTLTGEDSSRTHAQVCVLGDLAPLGRGLPGTVPAFQTQPPIVRTATADSSRPRLPATPHRLPASRAPPFVLA